MAQDSENEASHSCAQSEQVEKRAAQSEGETSPGDKGGPPRDHQRDSIHSESTDRTPWMWIQGLS